MKLGRAIVTGIFWSVLAQWAREFLGLLFTLILARLLTPVEFGLIGMITVFTGFMRVFGDLGFGSAIIQDQSISEEQLSSIFWLNLVFSSFLTLLAAASAPIVSRFYNEPSVTPIMLVMSLNFALIGAGKVHATLLTKQLAFKVISTRRVISLFLAGIIGVGCAIAGLGVWALVAQTLAITLIDLFYNWQLVPWRPSLHFKPAGIKRHVRFGFELQTSEVLNYGMRHVDDMLIGRVSGSQALGVYQMAYRIMLWPMQMVSRQIGAVMRSALSKIQDDKGRVKGVFLRTNRSIALVTFPMAFGILVTAPSLVSVFLGDKWEAVTPILQVLCILGATQSIGTNFGWLFVSQGRADVSLKLSLIFAPITIVSFFIGIQWGPLGVAVAYLLANILFDPIKWHLAGKIIDLTFWEAVRNVASIFFMAVLMAMVVWLVGYFLPIDAPSLLILALQVTVGILVYLSLVLLIRPAAYEDLRDVGTRHFSLRKRPAEIARPL
jgi:O-antigen/teichoic acid export membrane protein